MAFSQGPCTLNAKTEYNGNIEEQVLVQPRQGGGGQGRLLGEYETSAHQIRGKGTIKSEQNMCKILNCKKAMIQV